MCLGIHLRFIYRLVRVVLITEHLVIIILNIITLSDVMYYIKMNNYKNLKQAFTQQPLLYITSWNLLLCYFYHTV